MSDAFKCSRCGEYKDGSGKHTRYGTYEGTSGFTPQYDFEHSIELCKECRNGLDSVVRDYLNYDEV
jgi:hypothetical protein